MKIFPILLLNLVSYFLISSCSSVKPTKADMKTDQMMIRLSEIAIEPQYLDEYLAILKEETEASIKLEPGVLSIYPMSQKENPTQIRILEIYANAKAYKSHIASPHFQHYKTSTLKMVKSLKLVDMDAINPQAMNQIFKK